MNPLDIIGNIPWMIICSLHFSIYVEFYIQLILLDHDCGKDKESRLLKHALISNHSVIDLKDLKIIDKNYHRNKYKRKISEALYIKQYRPLLNSQEYSVQLKLFN